MKRLQIRTVFFFSLLAFITYAIAFVHWHSLVGTQSDYLEHFSTINALRDSILAPIHPLFNKYTPHIFFTPYHILLAFVSNVLGISTQLVLGISGVLNFWINMPRAQYVLRQSPCA